MSASFCLLGAVLIYLVLYQFLCPHDLLKAVSYIMLHMFYEPFLLLADFAGKGWGNDDGRPDSASKVEIASIHPLCLKQQGVSYRRRDVALGFECTWLFAHFMMR